MQFSATRLFTYFVLFFGVCMAGAIAQAQTSDTFSIRVESSEVLVPVYVLDRDRAKRPPSELNDDQVLDLKQNQFHVFEDGVEQRIRRVRVQHRRSRKVVDNLGYHREWMDTPAGKWSSTEIEPPVDVADAGYYYVLAYPRTQSTPGSCHRVEVKVDRPASLVYARSRYCNIDYSPSDPLKATALSSKLEAYAAGNKNGSIPLSVQAGLFYATSGMSRVDLTAEFPWQTMQRRWVKNVLQAEIGILGLIYTKKDHALAARFSDLGCCSQDKPNLARGNMPSKVYSYFDQVSIPTRFETQVQLAPGEYEAVVVVTDGEKFGRAKIPITVEDRDAVHLGISSVLLCGRFRPIPAPSKEAPERDDSFVSLVSNDIEFTPAAQLRFHRDKLLVAYFELYPPTNHTLADVGATVHLRVLDTKTGELKINAPSMKPEAPQSATGAVTSALKIDISSFTPGTYSLDIQASDASGYKTPVRTASFSVE